MKRPNPLKTKVVDRTPGATDASADHSGDGHSFTTPLNAFLGHLIVSDDAEDDRQCRRDNHTTCREADDAQHQ